MVLLKSHAVYDAGGNGNCGPLCLAAFLKILQHSKNPSPGLTSCEIDIIMKQFENALQNLEGSNQSLHRIGQI